MEPKPELLKYKDLISSLLNHNLCVRVVNLRPPLQLKPAPLFLHSNEQ